MSELWEIHKKVSRRRSFSYATINPLTYQELQAFEAKTFYELTAWEAETIIDLDDTARGAYHYDPKKGDAAVAEPEIDEETNSIAIPMSNGKAIKALFQGIAVRKAAQFAKDIEQ